MKVIVLVLVGLVASGFQPGSTQSIGVYSDSTCSSSCFERSPGQFMTLYLAFVPGDFAPEMTGAEFRVTGLPEDWLIVASTPNPAASIVIGDPFEGEFFIGFPECQTASCVVLYTAHIVLTSTVENRTLEVAPNYWCPGTPCFAPIAVLCDAPVFTKIFIPGVNGVINPSEGCATVSLQLQTWGSVKALYGRRE